MTLAALLLVLAGAMHWIEPGRIPSWISDAQVRLWEMFASVPLSDVAQPESATTSEQRAAQWSRIEHLPAPPPECLAGGAEAIEPATHRVFRWVDGDGIVHYSDRAPEQDGIASTEIGMPDLQPVQVSARTLGVPMAQVDLDRARIDTIGMSKVFRDVLGVPTGGRLLLDLTFVGDQRSFAELAGHEHLAQSQGAYLPGERKVLVRIQRDHQGTMRVLRHEIAHALVHEWVGRLPLALNEGLAEYFARFRVAGLGGYSDLQALGPRVRSFAPGDPGKDLPRLLALDFRSFYGPDSARHYAQALALVSVLMADQPGRVALAEVARAQRADSCRPVDAPGILALHYPGGLAALAERWRRAMDAGSLPVARL